MDFRNRWQHEERLALHLLVPDHQAGAKLVDGCSQPPLLKASVGSAESDLQAELADPKQAVT